MLNGKSSSVGMAQDMGLVPSMFSTPKVGAMEGGQLYALDNYRQGEIGFASRLTFTAGAVNPLITITGAV